MKKSQWKHTLTEIDPASSTGQCLTCGRVELRFRAKRKKWVCLPHLKELARQAPRARRDRVQGLIPKHLFTKALQDQRGLCAICELAIDRSACADHDHQTGCFRGVLCRSCNIGLGFFRDAPATLIKAAEYLRRSILRAA